MSSVPPRKFHLFLLGLAMVAAWIVIWLGPEGISNMATGKKTEKAVPWDGGGDHYRRPTYGLQAEAVAPADAETIPAREGERILRFKDDAAYQRFLERAAAAGVVVLGRLDPLRTLRIGILDPAKWDALPDSEKGTVAMNFLVTVPDLPEGGIQAGATGFGSNLLAWLGISGDNADWGKGITVAVLDTGVAAHPGLGTEIVSLSLLETPSDPAANGHGTGVASLIAGNSPQTPGLAPAAGILSVQVVDASGISDTFLVARGILAAVDGGASVINISLGSPGDSQVLRDAVAYARERGAVVVASAGNNGIDGVSYPAAYDGVIAVGAVDARSEKLDFSNTGWALDTTAPGYDLQVAWPGDLVAGFSGTSASAPIVSGAIAATMAKWDLSAAEAAALVLGTTNEAGDLGADPWFGNGVIDVGRVMQSRTPGILDAAVATQSLRVDSSGGNISTIVQNRGTETLSDVNLTVTAAGKQVTVNTGKLAPGQAVQRTVQLGQAADFQKPGAFIQSTVALPPGPGSDTNPANNSRRAGVGTGN